MSARRYFDILIDTLVVQPIGPFAKSQRVRLVQHSHFYFFDVGVLNGALNNFEASNDRIGKLFEHLVLQLIRSEFQGRDEEIRFSTYRTEAGSEVDLILERKGAVFAIEIKASKRVGPGDLRGLKSFAAYYGKKHTPLVIYMGDHPACIDGVEVLTPSKALELLTSG